MRRLFAGFFATLRRAFARAFGRVLAACEASATATDFRAQISQRFAVFDDVGRHLVVRQYGFRPSGEWHEARHAARDVVGAGAAVRLEEQRVVVDEAEEQIAAVEPDTTEHAARAQARNTFELFEDVGEILRSHGHSGCAQRPEARKFGAKRLEQRCRGDRSQRWARYSSRRSRDAPCASLPARCDSAESHAHAAQVPRCRRSRS